MTKRSAMKLARQYRARGLRFRVVRHRGVNWKNRLAVFYTVNVVM